MAHFGHSCSLGTRGSWNQDTTLQNQAVPVQGGVAGAQDQQRRHVYDPGIHTEDQGLAFAKVRERSSYFLGIHWVLWNLHTTILGVKAGCLVWYFDPRITPGTSHKLRSFLVGPCLIVLALAETKLLYFPGEERLVSLDVLKLYCGEDLILQNPEDVDPD